MADVRCPLCRSQQVQPIDRINVDDLVRLWDRGIGPGAAAEFGPLREINYLTCELCGLRFFHPPVAGSAAFYERLIERATTYYMEEKAEYDFAREFITPGMKVLEVGAGRGAFAARLEGVDYLGLELTAKAVSLAEAAGVRVIQRLLDAHAPEHQETYDVVCSFQVAEHVADTHGFISKCVGCLKPDGLLILSVPNADAYPALLPNPTRNLPPHHLSHWPEATLRNLAHVFPLDLVALERESLSVVHQRDYARVVCLLVLNDLLGRRERLVDLRLRARLIHKAAGCLAALYVRGLSDRRVLPRGHSVTAVYTRRTHGPARRNLPVAAGER